jgi:hypothetical protein
METDYIIDDNEPDFSSMSEEEFIKSQNEYMDKALRQSRKLDLKNLATQTQNN